jgi:hypothetical protein
MDRLYRSSSLTLILCLLISTMPAMAQNGTLTCSSKDGGYRYCRADTQNNVRLTRKISGSACTQGYSWGYDYRGIWVDRGCRAEFAFGNSGSGGNNTGAAIAAGILGAIVIGSIVASQNDSNDNDDSRRDAYRDGYRRGQQDWDNDLDPNYGRYRNRYSSQYQNDFVAGYDDGYNNRPNRYR